MHYNMGYPKDKSAMPLLRPNKAFPGRKPRSQKPKPFDPEDLSRRLHVVLAEQTAHAEKKQRRAKAEADGQAKQSTRTERRSNDALQDAAQEKAAKDPRPKAAEAQSSAANNDLEGDKLHRSTSKTIKGLTDAEDGGLATYRHVPQVAASQFARTTTVGTLPDTSLTHKLSKTAMKFHKDGPNASREMAAVQESTAPNEQVKALKRAQSQREKQYERNQFQHPVSLETSVEANAVVDEKQSQRAHRHTFKSHLKTKGIDPDDENAWRRRSAGSMLGNAEAALSSLEANSHPHTAKTHDSFESREHLGNVEEHRVDWTQSDEGPGQQGSLEGPILRKPESRWTLRGRLGSLTRNGRDGRALSPPAEGTAEESPLSPKLGFFARFKR